MQTPSTAPQAHNSSVTLPRDLACQIADCLYSLAQFASHAETMAAGAHIISQSGKAHQARQMMRVLEEQAANAQNLNGLNLSAAVNALIEEAEA